MSVRAARQGPRLPWPPQRGFRQINDVIGKMPIKDQGLSHRLSNVDNEASSMRKRNLLAIAILPLAFAGRIRADEVRNNEENGITYRETRRKVTEPVTEVQCVDRQTTTGFREQVNVQMCDQVRSY